MAKEPGKKLQKLAQLLFREAYQVNQKHPFTLSSGKKSPIFLDCARVFRTPRGSHLIGDIIYGRLLPSINLIGGPSTGADPIAAAVTNYRNQITPVSWFSVRKLPKQDGSWIEGPGDEDIGRVCAIEDVITTGISMINAIGRMFDEKMNVKQAIVIVDREEFGARNMVEHFCLANKVAFSSILRISEMEALSRG